MCFPDTTPSRAASRCSSRPSIWAVRSTQISWKTLRLEQKCSNGTSYVTVPEIVQQRRIVDHFLYFQDPNRQCSWESRDQWTSIVLSSWILSKPRKSSVSLRTHMSATMKIVWTLTSGVSGISTLTTYVSWASFATFSFFSTPPFKVTGTILCLWNGSTLVRLK